MQTKIMTLFTRTPLHVGCGSSVGAVDQPVARERHTRFPVIPGSAIKGVLADLWNEKGGDGKAAQQIHKDLERRIAAFAGTDDAILYSSCFDANGGLFETLLGPVLAWSGISGRARRIAEISPIS